MNKNNTYGVNNSTIYYYTYIDNNTNKLPWPLTTDLSRLNVVPVTGSWVGNGGLTGGVGMDSEALACPLSASGELGARVLRGLACA